MVFVRKRKIGKSAYYYLVKSIRVGRDKWKKIERYIGKKYPTLEQIKGFRASLPTTKERLELTGKELEILKEIRERFQTRFKEFSEAQKEKYLKQVSIKYTYNSNAIEGSTLTLRDTALILKDRMTPKGKELKEIKEAENHEKCINKTLAYKKDLNLKFIFELHKILMSGIDDENAGIIRKIEVSIEGSAFKPPAPSLLRDMLKDFIAWYKRNKKMHQLLLAALVHLKFVTIHPFADGNGRISRLLMNFVLHKDGYPMLNIRYANKEDYYDALEDCQVSGIEKPFVDYIKQEYFREHEKKRSLY